MPLDLAIDVIDYTARQDYKTTYVPVKNKPVELVKCPYFTTNLLEIDCLAGRPLMERDIFVIYLCVEGALIIDCLGMKETLSKGETLLVPACIADIHLQPKEKTKVLEIYI
jgi:mannose-6-phosphate isomerase